MIDEIFNTEREEFVKELNMLECLTRKRIEVLKTIMDSQPKSIRGLSRIMDRNVKNVFEDLLLLEKNNFIRFRKHGRSKKPVVKVEKIIIKFRK